MIEERHRYQYSRKKIQLAVNNYNYSEGACKLLQRTYHKSHKSQIWAIPCSLVLTELYLSTRFDRVRNQNNRMKVKNTHKNLGTKTSHASTTNNGYNKNNNNNFFGYKKKLLHPKNNNYYY